MKDDELVPVVPAVSAEGPQDGARDMPDNLVQLGLRRPRGDPYALGLKKLAIVGFAPSSCLLAPFTNTEWTIANGCEIWGLNDLFAVPGVTRADRWFDLHDRRGGDVSYRSPQNIEFLNKAALPIYMQEKYPDIPGSVRYPREAVVEHFQTNYFTNTISYEIALAILEGRDERGFVLDPKLAFGEIQIFGVDMAQLGNPDEQGEYSWQRPSCEYFLGWVRALGIKLYVPAQSDLLKTTGMYGYQTNAARDFVQKLRARRQELNARRVAAVNQAQALQMQAAALEGAIDDTRYIERSWTPNE